MSLYLGIDLGTSYFKVGLFDAAGSLKGLGRVAVDPRTPRPGRYELPAQAFWQKLRRGLDEALAQAGARADSIAALSYSSQANSFLILDQADAPLTPLILWTDTRGAEVPPAWEEFSQTEPFRRHVGFAGISGGFAVGKWLWIEKNQPEIWAKARRLLTISDYFTYALTGEPVGDGSTAAFLGIFDLTAGTWWERSLATFSIDAGKLSRPIRPGSRCGVVSARGAALLGVPSGTAVAVGGLDHHIAAVGSGVGRFAEMSISTGTVLAALALVDEPAPKEGCYHGPHVDGQRYFRLAFDPDGAGQLEDYQKRFSPGLSIEQLIALAAKTPAGSRPSGTPTAGASDKEHGARIRCILEKVAATHCRLARDAADPGSVRRIVATGGGARSPFWLQIKADMLGIPIVKSSSSERACLGAAAIAAAAAGAYASVDEATLGMVHPGDTFDPDPKVTEFYRKLAAQ